MKRFGMTLVICILLMIPTVLTLAEPEAITVEPTIQDELVSIDDFILSLDGEIEELETDQTYVYTLDEQIITIDLTTGYSLVNDQSEPYLLIPSELDESILNIVWFLPQQIKEDIFVPIQFIERVFNATYDAEKEWFVLNEPVEIEEAVEEEEEEMIPSENPIELPSTSEDEEEIVEEAPVSTPSTPTPPKQENPKPSTPTPPKQENPTPPVEVPEVETPPVVEETPEEPVIPAPPVEETPEEPVTPTPPVEETSDNQTPSTQTSVETSEIQ